MSQTNPVSLSDAREAAPVAATVSVVAGPVTDTTRECTLAVIRRGDGPLTLARQAERNRKDDAGEVVKDDAGEAVRESYWKPTAALADIGSAVALSLIA